MRRPLIRAIDPDDPTLTLAAVLDVLPIVAYIADPEGVVTFLSRGFETLTGNTTREVLDRGYECVVFPGDLARVTAAWDAARCAGNGYRDEMRIRVRDGSFRWMLSEAAPLRHKGGKIAGWFGSLTDIHDLRIAQETIVRARDTANILATEASARAEFVERLMDASDDCIKVLDLEARLVSMSPNGQKALAIMNFASVAGADWREFWTGADRSAARAAVDAALLGERGQFTGLFPVSGRDLWWDVTVTPILGRDGKPERLLAVSRNVTEKLRVERALAQSEERYRLLGEALPGTTWTATSEGRLDYISGRSADDHLLAAGRLDDLWLESVHPGERERVIARWISSVETGDPYEIQFPVQTANGAYRWQLVRALAQRDASGAIVRWVGVNVDIDEQRRADEEREQFVRLVEASGDFICIADESGRTTYLNEAGRSLLGIGTLEGAAPLHIADSCAPDERAFLESTILPSIAREGRWTGEFSLRHAVTGEHVPMWHNAFSLSNESGQRVATATVGRDLREQQRFEIGMRALAETGAAMYGSLDFAETVGNVAEAVVQTFASFCVVDVFDANGGVVSTLATHLGMDAGLKAERAKLVRVRSPGDAVKRALLGQSTLLATLPDDWLRDAAFGRPFLERTGRLDARSLIVVPIASAQDKSVIGALTCVLDASDRRGKYSIEDLRFAEEIAVRAGLAFYHARAYEHERRIAVTLQEASLPRVLPALAGLSLSADYRPGNSEATIGGDWYDAFVLDDGRLAITVGDVLGSGLGAAVTMGKVRQAMRSAAMLIPTPCAMLDVADYTVRAESADMYATALAGIYDPQSHEFTFASAGHPGPIRRDAAGRIEQFSAPGILLGLRSRGDTSAVTIDAGAESSLVFFTDGLIEATRDLERGHERVCAALADADTARTDNAAHALVEHVLHGEPPTDDIAVLFAEFLRT